ncbi:CBS domain-containing protein [Thauera phenylacetica]
MPSRPIHQVLSDRPFVSVPADTPVREVVRQMSALQRSAALVTEHGVLTGIFTERDAAFGVLAAGLDADTTPVGAVMTHNPVTLTEDRPFGHALHLMYENGVRHVPIVRRQPPPARRGHCARRTATRRAHLRRRAGAARGDHGHPVSGLVRGLRRSYRGPEARRLM